MTDGIREIISASVDDELSELERARVVRTLGEETAERERWARYHLIGDALRESLPEQLDPDMATRISRHLGDSTQGTQGAPPRRVRGPLAGLAIAASVALVAVVGVRTVDIEGGGSGDPALVASVPPASVDNPVVASGTRWQVSQPGVEDKLNGYLVNHYEYAPAGSITGVMPYASIVSYDRK